MQLNYDFEIRTKEQEPFGYKNNKVQTNIKMMGGKRVALSEIAWIFKQEPRSKILPRLDVQATPCENSYRALPR